MAPLPLSNLCNTVGDGFAERQLTLQANNFTHPRTGANQAVRDSIATRTHAHSSEERQCRLRQVLLCQSQGRQGRGRRAHRQERGHCPQWCRVDDACEEPLCPCRRIRENCASHGCRPAQESDLDFVFRPAMKGFRRQVPVSTGGDVCRVLTRSSDGRVRPPVPGPHKRATVNTLMPQFSDCVPL